MNELRSALEALLFVSDEPVSGARLAQVLNRPAGDIDAALVDLAQEYKDDERGFQLREVAGGWRLYTHPAHHELIESYVLSWDTRRLSQAALEVLAVVAYHQPVTRNGINAVRGVNSEGVISSLIEKGLIREDGRDRNQGNAILYATTRSFLEKFGLKDLNALPPLSAFAPDDATQTVIKRRLGVETPAANTGDEEIDAQVDAHEDLSEDTDDDIIGID